MEKIHIYSLFNLPFIFWGQWTCSVKFKPFIQSLCITIVLSTLLKHCILSFFFTLQIRWRQTHYREFIIFYLKIFLLTSHQIKVPDRDQLPSSLLCRFSHSDHWDSAGHNINIIHKLNIRSILAFRSIYKFCWINIYIKFHLLST